jgi:hypothetical protein
MIRSIILSITLLFFWTGNVPAQETSLQDFINVMSGRWVCDTTADMNIPGYTKKGDPIRLEITYSPLSDGSGVRQDWQLENQGTVRGSSHGITFWNPASKRIKTYATATGGFHVEGEHWKEGDQWMTKSVVTFPDGSKSRSTIITELSKDGNTRTLAITNRINHQGEELEDKTEVWTRAAKNGEILEKQLGWLVGTWTAEMDAPDEGRIPVVGEYRWIAKNQVISLNLKIGSWEGLSIVFYDPYDQQIKMWGANSDGGNGQATLRVEGNNLIWTNTVVEGDKKSRMDFTYIKKDEDTMIVKYVDPVDGKTKEMLNKRK